MCVNGTVYYVYKVKSPCLVKHPAIKVYGRMEEWLCVCLILAIYLDGAFHALAAKNSLPMLGIKPC
jgi:hypothetical protein